MEAPPGATTKPKSGLSIVMVWGLVALAVGWYFIARSGKSVSTAIAGPTTLANERVQLHEGQWKAYGVLLDAPRKVAVHVDAAPMAVDVVTMAKEEYDQFEKVHKALFGVRYKHIPALGSSDRRRLHLPDVPCVLRDRPIARELAGGRHVQDGLARPRIRIPVERAELAIRLEIRAEVCKVHVVIAPEQRLAQRCEDAGLVAAEMVGRNQVQRGTHLWLVVVVPAWAVPATAVRDLVGGEPEQKEVLLARLLRHLDGGSVACAQCDRTVHHELHVAGAARLVSGGGDLVGDVARGNDPFRERDGVFGQEQDVQPPARHGIVVDRGREVVEELDDQLCKPVARRRLAREQKRPRRHLQVWIVTQPVVKHDDPQGIEQLPLVFVDALDLTVEHRSGIHCQRQARFEPLGECGLGCPFRRAKRISETRVVREWLQSSELPEIGDPIVTDTVHDRPREVRVCE